jgi:hypothetical protein
VCIRFDGEHQHLPGLRGDRHDSLLPGCSDRSGVYAYDSRDSGVRDIGACDDQHHGSTTARHNHGHNFHSMTRWIIAALGLGLLAQGPTPEPPTGAVCVVAQSGAYPTFNQALSLNVCQRTSTGVTNFACTMTWTMAQSQPTWFWFVPDVSATGPAWMTVATNGPQSKQISIKDSTGQNDPGASILAGKPMLLFWDGSVYRQMI